MTVVETISNSITALYEWLTVQPTKTFQHNEKELNKDTKYVRKMTYSQT